MDDTTLLRALGATLAGAVVSTLLLVGGAPAASAHDDHGPGGLTDAQHARQDLAGTSMSDVLADTRAGARDRSPATQQAVEQGQARAVAAAADAGSGVAGSWSAPRATAILPAFQAVLPSGKVLMWDSVGDGATESYSNHTFTRAMVWNPSDDSYRRVDVTGYNIFCAGYVQLPDGNVLVVGGNKDSALGGIKQTHLFDWRTETWSRGPDMASERWYPSVAALANGEAVIVAGGSGRAEVYQTDGSLRSLTGFTSFADRVYPFLVPRNDGRVELVGPGTMNTMDTSGAGTLVATRSRDGVNRDYGSFATYLPGRTLVTGGGSVTEGGVSQVPTRTSVVVDTTGSGTAVTPAASMAFPRRQHSLTVLADGSVLATGGQSRSVDGLVDLANPVLAAERWDPATDRWTTLAAAAKVREYHSTAALLPDGRVLTGGGGICGVCVQKGYLEKNVEYFTPPYLYRHDGSGQLAVRPQVSSAPASVQVGGTFALTSPQASTITKLDLVRLGAPTHGVDQGQRFVPLSFTRSGETLAVTAPASSALAPPGYYMLFAVDSAGVPSVASMVQVRGASVTTPPTGGGTPTGNLARGKSATASSSSWFQGPAKAVDGSTSSRWSTSGGDGQWWQVDLGTSRSVDTVSVAWAAAYAARYEVQTSLDGRTFSAAATLTPTAAGTQRPTFALRQARYVRVLGVTRGTRSGFAINEVEVYGRQ